MKFDFHIQKVEFKFKTFGTGKVELLINGEQAKNINLSKKNIIRINFTKDDPSDVSSYALIDGIIVNGFDIKENFKALDYVIDANKHKVEKTIINNNLYLGYVGFMEFIIEHRDDQLFNAAWTIADKEFENLTRPTKGQQHRQKDFHTVRRDAVFMFTGCHPPKTKTIKDIIDVYKIEDLSNTLMSDDRYKIEDWINKSSRVKMANFDVMNHFTVGTGSTEFLNSFIQSSNVIYMPEKMYYHNREILQDKKITVRDALNEKFEKGSNVLFEMPSPWYQTEDMQNKIKEARDADCNIALDLTWLPVSNSPVNIDLNMVDQVFFSMNKCWPLTALRPALRWSKNRINDSQTFDNEFDLYPKIPVNMLMILVGKIDFDYTFNLYADKVNHLCEKFRLEKTNVLWFTKHKDIEHNVNNHISNHYHLDEFVCVVELLEHTDRYFW